MNEISNDKGVLHKEILFHREFQNCLCFELDTQAAKEFMGGGGAGRMLSVNQSCFLLLHIGAHQS